MDIKEIVSCLVKGKKSIFNCEVKVGTRKFQLAGVGKQALKVRVKSPQGFPHLELNGFINWSEYDKFTKQEKELVQKFIDELP